MKWTVIAICGLASLVPILIVIPSDGPRAPYGRLWTPPLWRRWQNAVSINFDELRSLVGPSRAASSAIITDTWDADRYLHLALLETGYRQTQRRNGNASCERTAEEFARGTERILHIRLHQPFLPNWRELAAARLDAWGRPCLESWRPSRIIWLAPVGQMGSGNLDSLSDDLPAARARALRIIADAHYSPQVPVELSMPGLKALRRAYQDDEEQTGTHNVRRPPASEVLAGAERLMAARVWK